MDFLPTIWLCILVPLLAVGVLAVLAGIVFAIYQTMVKRNIAAQGIQYIINAIKTRSAIEWNNFKVPYLILKKPKVALLYILSLFAGCGMVWLLFSACGFTQIQMIWGFVTVLIIFFVIQPCPMLSLTAIITLSLFLQSLHQLIRLLQ